MPAKRRRNQTGRRIVTGIDEVDALLRDFTTPGIANRIAKAGLGKGLTVLAKAMRAGAPNKSLRNAIGRRNAKPKGKAMHVAKVGLNVGKKAGKGRMPHAHLLVFGTADRMRGNKLSQTERAQPGNKVGGPGPKGKRGIGGRFSHMETLRPDLQWKRRTGRIKTGTSFVRTAAQGREAAVRKAISDGVIKAIERETAKINRRVDARATAS